MVCPAKESHCACAECRAKESRLRRRGAWGVTETALAKSGPEAADSSPSHRRSSSSVAHTFRAECQLLIVGFINTNFRRWKMW
ncbi:hypothetical protein scyTo_0020805 [Scyliorhinus torazame]|uniref:Uncharacterized protein n=1 Tax=Scyliorhinus torazame TaxID=75743 RepID=A0A401PNY6_SCYTO|nr:hypothetical protein [Scyliorhinus torazame]